MFKYFEKILLSVKSLSSPRQNEVYFIGGGAAGVLWRHRTWSPSWPPFWISLRNKNQIKEYLEIWKTYLAIKLRIALNFFINKKRFSPPPPASSQSEIALAHPPPSQPPFYINEDRSLSTTETWVPDQTLKPSSSHREPILRAVCERWGIVLLSDSFLRLIMTVIYLQQWKKGRKSTVRKTVVWLSRYCSLFPCCDTITSERRKSHLQQGDRALCYDCGWLFNTHQALQKVGNLYDVSWGRQCHHDNIKYLWLYSSIWHFKTARNNYSLIQMFLVLTGFDDLENVLLKSA